MPTDEKLHIKDMEVERLTLVSPDGERTVLMLNDAGEPALSFYVLL